MNLNQNTTDTTTMQVEAILLNGLREAYGLVGDPVDCASCGARTDTRDGYDVETPLGEVWVCPTCNRDPKLWDTNEVFFTGATR